MKLSQRLIDSICEDIAKGLCNRDAAAVNGISDTCYYNWRREGHKYANQPEDELTEPQLLCRRFVEQLETATLKRKQELVASLQKSHSPVGQIYLLKQLYPSEFNKEPIMIPNFSALFSFMRSEYTQGEIEAIEKAILAAEQRRQSDIAFDEHELFSELEPGEPLPLPEVTDGDD